MKYRLNFFNLSKVFCAPDLTGNLLCQGEDGTQAIIVFLTVMAK